MRIQVVSDLHLEWFISKDAWKDFIDYLYSPGTPTLVIAGDLCEFSMLPEVLGYISNKYWHVIYVPGNHEYYRRNFVRTREAISNLKIPRVSILDGAITTIDGQRFLGATLWFRDRPDNFMYTHGMSDFDKIKKFAPEVYHLSDRQEQWLNDNIVEGDIVITHHLPTEASVAKPYKGSQLNRFFVREMSETIFEKKPRLWIHGHTHFSMDYTLGNTRIVANPFGYINYERNREFNERLIIEL